MKIDFTQVLKDFDGNPFPGKDDKDVTLGFICVDALLAVFKKEQENPDAADYIKRYEFAKAIHKGEEMDLKAEDIALLKGRLLKTRPALIYGLASDMLEKKDVRTDEPTVRPKPINKNSKRGGDSV